LNLNIHFHILFRDGVYVYRDNRSPRFQRVNAPDKDELENLAPPEYSIPLILLTIFGNGRTYHQGLKPPPNPTRSAHPAPTHPHNPMHPITRDDCVRFGLPQSRRV
jgi:hypothetical protein